MLTSKSSSNNRLRAQLREAFKRGYKKALNEAKPNSFARILQSRASANDPSDFMNSSQDQQVSAVVVSGNYHKSSTMVSSGKGWLDFHAESIETGIADVSHSTIKINIDSDYITIRPDDVIDADWVSTTNIWGNNWGNGVYYIITRNYVIFLAIKGDVRSVEEIVQGHFE